MDIEAWAEAVSTTKASQPSHPHLSSLSFHPSFLPPSMCACRQEQMVSSFTNIFDDPKDYKRTRSIWGNNTKNPQDKTLTWPQSMDRKQRWITPENHASQQTHASSLIKVFFPLFIFQVFFSCVFTLLYQKFPFFFFWLPFNCLPTWLTEDHAFIMLGQDHYLIKEKKKKVKERKRIFFFLKRPKTFTIVLKTLPPTDFLPSLCDFNL